MSSQGTLQRVRHVDDEDLLMASCSCGGSWRLHSNDVAPVAGRWHDRLGVVCDRCGQPKSFVFDITAFFVSRPGVWGRTVVASRAQRGFLGPSRLERARRVRLHSKSGVEDEL